jgi:hypothetical protein
VVGVTHGAVPGTVRFHGDETVCVENPRCQQLEGLGRHLDNEFVRKGAGSDTRVFVDSEDVHSGLNGKLIIAEKEPE